MNVQADKTRQRELATSSDVTTANKDNATLSSLHPPVPFLCSATSHLALHEVLGQLPLNWKLSFRFIQCNFIGNTNTSQNPLRNTRMVLIQIAQVPWQSAYRNSRAQCSPARNPLSCTQTPLTGCGTHLKSWFARPHPI